MVWIGGGVEIFQVTTGTIVPNSFKLQNRGRLVALGAIRPLMHARQWKTIFLMQGGNIIHHPVVGLVAAGAIRSYGLLVWISMAGNTIGGSF